MERATGEQRLIAVIGGRGAAEADELEHAVETGATALLVDLSQTPSVATHELNALLRARSGVLSRGGRIALVVPHRLRRLLELMRFERRFLLADDRLQAVQLLGLTRAVGPDTRSPAPFRRAA